jgi:hypothetical protein
VEPEAAKDAAAKLCRWFFWAPLRSMQRLKQNNKDFFK